MKKFFLMGSALLMVLAMTSCKSSESAYKKAYEKAQAAQTENAATQFVVDNNQQTTPVQVTPVTPVTPVTTVTTTPATTTTVTPVTPVTTVTTTPVTPVTPVTTVDYSNVSVRTETVQLVNGSGLKAFSVVVGSFGLESNARSLQATLAQQGYAAQVVSAAVNGMTMYRVVATTFDTKEQAAQSRATLLGSYPDAWLLYQK